MSAHLDRPHGEVFVDARGNGRAMRLTWHHEADLVVLSMWRDGFCAGTFRLAKEDVNEFIDALVDGLRDAPGVHLSPGAAASAAPASAPQSLIEPVLPIETGESSFPDLTEPESAPSFTEWAFAHDEGHATAS